jgi:hypothetical protein
LVKKIGKKIKLGKMKRSYESTKFWLLKTGIIYLGKKSKLGKMLVKKNAW